MIYKHTHIAGLSQIYLRDRDQTYSKSWDTKLADLELGKKFREKNS
jgi:hypothetical protein